MTPTLFRHDGFEHGLTSSGTGGVWTITPGGSPAIVTSPVRTGARALEISAAAAAEQVGYNPGASQRLACMSFYVRFASLPSGAEFRLANFNTASGKGYVGYSNSAGQFRISVGGSVWASIPSDTVVVDQWYLIDVKFDSSADPAVITAKVDGGTEASTNRSQAAADMTAIMLGTDSAQTYTAYFDDWLICLNTSDYPIGEHSVERLMPTADGTHSISGANEIERSATGTDITNSTTDAYTLIDDAPLDTTPTDYINDVGTNAASYVEVTFEDLAAGTDLPIDVRALAVDRDSTNTGTSAAVSRVLLADGTAVSPDVRLSTDDPGVTVTVRKPMFTRPSGDWDRDKVNGLKARLGLGDGAPDVWFASLMLEVAMQPAEVVVAPGLISQAGATFSPTITPGNVNVVPDLISQIGATFSPTIASSGGAQSVTAGLIQQLAATFDVTVVPGNLNIVPPLLGAAASVFAMSIEQAGGGGGGGGGFMSRYRRRRRK